MSHVRYELSFYIQENDILHSHRRGSLKTYNSIIVINSSLCPPGRNRILTISPNNACLLKTNFILWMNVGRCRLIHYFIEYVWNSECKSLISQVCHMP
jgi:hypothetical protein